MKKVLIIIAIVTTLAFACSCSSLATPPSSPTVSVTVDGVTYPVESTNEFAYVTTVGRTRITANDTASFRMKIRAAANQNYALQNDGKATVSYGKFIEG